MTTHELRSCLPKAPRRSNVSSWRIPLTDLDYGEEELAAVQRVVQSNWLSMGPEVELFESEFARFVGAKHAIAISSATAGLHLALAVLDVGPGDEVIQPALNFVAAANMTVALGATPVFADLIGFEEPHLDPQHTQQLITERTKAIVVMHYGGSICRMNDLRQICQQHQLPLVEDACHAVGAHYDDPLATGLHGQLAGALGDLGVFSFFSNKNLATGEGGMVVTSRDDIAERLRLLRSHGMTSLTWDRHRGHASSYDVAVPGFNYRLDELHAALGRAQLAKLPANNERRRRLQAEYRRELRPLAGWILPFADRNDEPSGHLMVVVAPSPEQRCAVVTKLREARVQTSLHYPCITEFAAFAATGTNNLSHSKQFAERAISLPIFPSMTVQQVREVCSMIRSAAA